MSRSSSYYLGFAAVLLALVGGCNGEESGPGESPLAMEKAPTKSGDGQEGLAGEQLASALRVIITRDGEPVGDVAVQWQTGDDGSLSPTSSNSDAEGIAESFWTLGPVVGTQSASARVTGAEGSPVTFNATATVEEPPPPAATVQVLSAGGDRFDPEDVTISAGQSVTWVWPEGSIAHNVVPDDDETPETSGGLVDGPFTHTATFTEPGVYLYYCANHGAPNGIGMSGTVTVLEVAP